MHKTTPMQLEELISFYSEEFDNHVHYKAMVEMLDAGYVVKLDSKRPDKEFYFKNKSSTSRETDNIPTLVIDADSQFSIEKYWELEYNSCNLFKSLIAYTDQVTKIKDAEPTLVEHLKVMNGVN
jgi:hypothetical protein